MSLTLLSASAAETRRLGEHLGEAINTGPLLLILSGDYGTGKTTFVQGLAQGMGFTGSLRSPSYLLARAYDTPRGRLVHADLYRLTEVAELADLGLPELVGDRGVIAVEWPLAATQRLVGWPTLTVGLSYVPDEDAVRKLALDWTSKVPEVLVEALHAAAAR